MKRIGILVVHGVGEQGRFEHLEAMASNLYKALDKAGRRPHMQVRHGGQDTRRSQQHAWREMPVLLRWEIGSAGPHQPKQEIEAGFREVHWADLDIPMSVWRWTKLVCWVLGMSGVRLYERRREDDRIAGDSCLRYPPRGLSFFRRLWVRLELSLISIVFALILISLELVYLLLGRFLSRFKWVEQSRYLIYDYLGDVKLYQDWFVRQDDAPETLGYKTRVAIRRRMVQALVQIAKAIELGELDEFYIFAHSLGTVVAFNALMECSATLPNYLTEEQWNDLPQFLKGQSVSDVPPNQRPSRPPWVGPKDAIDRDQLFKGLRGFLTLGSPLDKFATLWPGIVLINGEHVTHPVSWINVADAQDIVAGRVDLFPQCGRAPGIGGLTLRNIRPQGQWVDQITLLTAHTSYWKSNRRADRLIDRVVRWLEGGDLIPPENRFSPTIARVIFAGSIIGFGGLFLILASALWWLLLKLTVGGELSSFGDVSKGLLLTDVVVVMLFSVIRWIWEWYLFGYKADRD